MLLTGDPIRVDLKYPESTDETLPPTPSLSCQGVSCEPFDASTWKGESLLGGAKGTASVSVIPITAGSLTLTATLKDLGASRTWTYGPFAIEKPDRIAAVCTVTGSPPRGCEAGLLTTDALRIELGLYVRQRRVVSPSLTVTVELVVR